MKSKPFWMPKMMSSRSFWLRYGMDRWTPGTLTPFLVLILPLFSTVQVMSVSVTFSMRSMIRPSSSMMVPPSWTSCGRSL